MRINIGDILKDPGATKEFAFILDSGMEAGEAKVTSPVRIEGRVVNTGRFLELVAHVSTEVAVPCSRCLDEVRLPLEFDVAELYQPAGWEDNGEEGEEEQALMALEGEWLDLDEAIKDNLVLNLPMRVLCSPECPGICPQCGRDLKKGLCSCIKEEIDPRLSILLKIKEAKNN